MDKDTTLTLTDLQKNMSDGISTFLKTIAKIDESTEKMQGVLRFQEAVWWFTAAIKDVMEKKERKN